jgi:putative flavoprotein involved in K+ transport
MPIERVETLVIGGGQAGLAMSHCLTQRGLSHLVLERGRIAERWRSERWDGLRFQFPNWSVRLPDFPFRHADPDGFATSQEILDFIAAYAAFVAPPIRCGIDVTRLRQSEDASAFVAETSCGVIEARNVVVATGPYQRAIIPRLSDAAAGIFQTHASLYRNPGQLPPGAVLVIGAGASGAQIAEELHRADRKVFLSVGRHNRLPRRYRGRDLIRWLAEMRIDQTPVEQRGPRRLLPVISGAHGGHTVDFRRFGAEGIILLGRVTSLSAGVVDIAPDLAESLANGDLHYATFLETVDAYVREHGLDCPEDPAARMRWPDPPAVTDPLRQLDLQAEGIRSLIWATGYGVDFGWIDISVFAQGEPVHVRGVTDMPGLYFLGLQWLSKMSSSFMSGVGDDAARLADHIAADAKKFGKKPSRM